MTSLAIRRLKAAVQVARAVSGLISRPLCLTFSRICSASLWAAAAGAATGVGIQYTAVNGGTDCTDSEGQWSTDCGIGADGAVLVRPDNHVAWRCSDCPADAAAALTAALEQVLARSQA